ncbi:MAG: hypothetical protein ACOYIK_09900 [Coriobacteriales bacterium]
MVDYDEAKKLALTCIDRVKICTEYENFYVFDHMEEQQMDSSIGMVAVDKATGECCNFVAVIPRLGKEIRVIDETATA